MSEDLNKVIRGDLVLISKDELLSYKELELAVRYSIAVLSPAKESYTDIGGVRRLKWCIDKLDNARTKDIK